MSKHVLIYGIAGGLLIGLLRLVEYRWLVLEHSLAIYGGVIAVLFAAVGIWLGGRLRRGRTAFDGTGAPSLDSRPVRETGDAPAPTAPVTSVEAPGLTPRELQILRLMAEGMSTREIAGRLFLSENTVKTHAGRLFGKLGARRRTQAVQLGRRHALIP